MLLGTANQISILQKIQIWMLAQTKKFFERCFYHLFIPLPFHANSHGRQRTNDCYTGSGLERLLMYNLSDFWTELYEWYDLRQLSLYPKQRLIENKLETQVVAIAKYMKNILHILQVLAHLQGRFDFEVFSLQPKRVCQWARMLVREFLWGGKKTKLSQTCNTKN